ncbi:MAG: tetratricopeptide repeat protein, partial [Candidatus Eremiobacterota bacterium]
KAFGNSLVNEITFGVCMITGTEHFKNRRYDQAFQYFYKAVVAEPYKADAIYNSALCLYNLGRYGEAMTYVNRAITLDPDNTKYKQLQANIKGKM